MTLIATASIPVSCTSVYVAHVEWEDLMLVCDFDLEVFASRLL